MPGIENTPARPFRAQNSARIRRQRPRYPDTGRFSHSYLRLSWTTTGAIGAAEALRQGEVRAAQAEPGRRAWSAVGVVDHNADDSEQRSAVPAAAHGPAAQLRQADPVSMQVRTGTAAR